MYKICLNNDNDRKYRTLDLKYDIFYTLSYQSISVESIVLYQDVFTLLIR